MRSRGFILKQTVFFMAILLGVFSLAGKYVRIGAGRERMVGENEDKNRILETIQEIALYELSLLDGYVQRAEVDSLEEYFYRNPEGGSILDNYEAFTIDREKNMVSMGGYYLAYINPPKEGLYIPNKRQPFTIILVKDIVLSQGENPVMKVQLRTGHIRIRCDFEPQKREIICENHWKLEELTAFGEDVNYNDEEGDKEQQK